MPNLSTETLSIIALLALVLSGLAVVLLVMTKGKRGPAGPLQMDDTLRDILDAHANKLTRLDAAIRKLAAESKRQGVTLRGAVQHVGLVRYDAFEDVGGRLSFSCALLDDNGDGVVVTSINGRQDTRVYAKPVTGGRSSHNLSQEEDAAIRQALSAPHEAVSAG